MRISEIDLENFQWVAIHSDKVIKKGKEQYLKINRKTLEAFEINFKTISYNVKDSFLEVKHIGAVHTRFKIKTRGKTLVYRLKSIGYLNTVQGGGLTKPHTRILVIALLEKNPDPTKNVKHENYEFDPTLSEIYYIFPTAEVQINNNFGDASPFSPIELREEELNHLNG